MFNLCWKEVQKSESKKCHPTKRHYVKKVQTYVPHKVTCNNTQFNVSVTCLINGENCLICRLTLFPMLL